MSQCEARREGDEMACRCGLRWPVDEVDPPVCPKEPSTVWQTVGIPAIPNIPMSTNFDNRRYCVVGDTSELPVTKALLKFLITPSFDYVEGRLLVDPPAQLLDAMMAEHKKALASGRGSETAMRRVYGLLVGALRR